MGLSKTYSPMDQGTPPEMHERAFTGEYAPRSASAKAAVELILRAISEAEAGEREQRDKSRRRRSTAQAKFDLAVTAVASELIFHEANGRAAGVFVPRSNAVLEEADPQRPEAINSLLPDALDRLERLAFIIQSKGYVNDEGERRRTVVTAGPALIDLIREHALTSEDVCRSGGGDVIVLRSRDADGNRQELSFADDGDTHRMRAELEAFNHFLAEANLDALTDDIKLPTVDLGNRRVRRIFSGGSFSSGGRHYGGYWQDMKGELRLERLLIGGEHVAELDYGQAGLRILYGLVGCDPPSGDLYWISEFSRLVNGRDDVKTMISAAMFVEDARSLAPIAKRLCPRIAAQGDPDLGDFGDDMVDDLALKEALGAITRRHAPVAHFLPSVIGHRVQNIESNVMMRALLDLMSKGIVALPVFDGVVVAASRVSEADAILRRVFKRVVGVDAEVSIELNPWHLESHP